MAKIPCDPRKGPCPPEEPEELQDNKDLKPDPAVDSEESKDKEKED